MKTTKEIKQTIKIIKQNKKVCVPTNFFGGNNLEALDVCLEVLENNLSEEEINKKYFLTSMKEPLYFLWNTAMSARAFMDEEIPIEYLLVPVKDKFTIM